MSMYCTLSHRKIHGWGHMRLVEQHNGREIDTPAREEDRPMPIEQLAGDGDMVDRTRALLTAKGVPHKLRKNTVLAYEDVYGASPGYWDARYPEGWKNVPVEVLERDPLAVALMQHVKLKYGEKLVSVRLHLDEKNPHWHVVSIPLVTGLHKQRGRKRKDGVVPPPIEKTTLYASHETERGGSGRRLEIEHDEWAESTKHLGLVRGARGSDLTAEEKRDRRLRDRQASRQGEDRARVRKEERDRAEAAETLMVTAAGDFVRIVEKGSNDASAIVAQARVEADRVLDDADRIKAEAAVSAETTKRQAESDARTAASVIREQADIDAARIRSNAKTEADRLAKVVEDREQRLLEEQQAIAEARLLVDADRQRVDLDKADVGLRTMATRRGEEILAARTAKVDKQATALTDLIARFEPMLAIVAWAHDRLLAAPVVIQRWLDPEGKVGVAVKATGPLLEEARMAALALGRKPKPVPQESLGIDAQAAFLAAIRQRND
jgi:hypothetical protein